MSADISLSAYHLNKIICKVEHFHCRKGSLSFFVYITGEDDDDDDGGDSSDSEQTETRSAGTNSGTSSPAPSTRGFGGKKLFKGGTLSSVQTSTMSKCSKKVLGPICRNLHVNEVQLFKGPFQIAFFPEFMVPFHYRYNYLH